MATLVLTVVGGIVAGPIGAAIGATAGQAIDRAVLFKPKGREGPRLKELALQTSSYGTPIAQVFGTMRVGGCVIWATDLIESRSSASAGKGQPKVTSYSYAASFAVALSGRPIAGVGRIWADGKLLRGAAGDFKSQTGFRLHRGGEDQPPDPLIAAAEGGLAPAHRGIAYAVFETLQLADYGNRIPSLTFEVIGDAAPPATGAMVTAIGGDIVDGGADDGPALPGFAAYGDTRAVLELLASASGAWFAAESGRVRLLLPGEAVAIDDEGAAAGEAGGLGGVRAVAAIESVPRRLSIAHYDPARDYQTGLQQARRPGAGSREERIELPAALSAEAAKTLAEAIIARGERARERRTVTLGWHALGIAPGACVTIAGAPGVYRVAGWMLEDMVVRLDCVRLAAASVPAPASPGRVLPAPDLVAGTTIVHVAELPPVDDTVLGAPRVIVAAAGTAPGWRRAALLYSLDGGARWTTAEPIAGPATIGTIVRPPGAGPASVIDGVATIEVDLAHEAMALAGADDAALIAGANIALVGDELIQFGVAVQTGPVRWRLSRLLRGRRGTEAAIGAQTAGDRFVLVEDDMVSTIALPLSAIGGSIRVLAAGIGDLTGPASADAAVSGRSVVPPSPVHLGWRPLPGGDAELRWIRRSRAGWRWIDGVDAPLGEEREAYRVTISPAGMAPRTVETDRPQLTIAAADRAAGPVTLSVRQIGAHGESAGAEIELPSVQEAP